MDKFGLLLGELDESEVQLAHQFREVAERQAAEHDVVDLCETSAKQCDKRIEWIASIASERELSVSQPPKEKLRKPIGAVVRPMARALGRHPEAAMLLLSDLRTLYLDVQRAEIGWTMVLQVLKAEEATEDLEAATEFHEQVVIQGKWLKTRIKVTVPQSILVPV